MTVDFRQLREHIYSEVELRNVNDPRWEWEVKLIQSQAIHIRWGLLDYLAGSKNAFSIQYHGDVFCIYTPNHIVVKQFKSKSVESAISYGVKCIEEYIRHKY